MSRYRLPPHFKTLPRRWRSQQSVLFSSWQIKKLPNLDGAAGVAVLDDVFGEGLGVLFFPEWIHAFELCEFFGAFERGLVVAVVVEPRDFAAFVFFAGHGRVGGIGVGELLP